MTTEVAWRERYEVFVPDGVAVRVQAITGVLGPCYAAWMREDCCGNLVRDLQECGKLQVFTSADQCLIGLQWTPIRGRKIRTKLLREPRWWTGSPHLVVVSDNVFGWTPPPKEKNRVHVVPFSRWDEIEAVLRSQVGKRTQVLFDWDAQHSEPVGVLHPPPNPQSHDGFARDDAVRRWALKRAAGNCELCGEKAPFHTADGEPFLEVHHIVRLADGGPDTPSNVAALCPNCHREVHLGSRAVHLHNRLLELRGDD